MDTLRSTIKSPLGAGFTLVELCIVLVIIGLIIGGVLVGRDLISAAGVRAQVSQIETFNTAVNTFSGKYGYLPGDISAAPATRFGFSPRGSYAGEGDGNGVIDGITADAPGSNNGDGYSATGEEAMFWVDLSAANLIEGSFSTATATDLPTLAQTEIPLYFPHSKAGGGSKGYIPSIRIINDGSINYYSIISIQKVTAGTPTFSNNTLSASQAYAIDAKIDDGWPFYGQVQDVYRKSGNTMSIYTSAGFPFATVVPPTLASAASATSCYDNGGVAGQKEHYSLAQGGEAATCTLMIQFQ
jgi:prepilin-type N-terminal cleavage/methylation domain-containing protein